MIGDHDGFEACSTDGKFRAGSIGGCDWSMELKIRWIGVLKIWRLRIDVAIDYEDILWNFELN
jgi:hypothetical protein